MVIAPAVFLVTALPTFAAGAADPASVRAAIDARLASMESAVLAADIPAYMTNIAAGDHEFTQEQQHWADDLTLHTPAEFDLSFVGDAGPSAAGNTAEAELSMTWKLPDGQARSVEYPVRFLEQEGAWLYAGEAWTIVDGQGIEALCAKGLENEGAEIARVFPEVRAHDEEGFELKVDRVQKVKLYASMDHLQASIYLSYVEGLGGWNEPGESIKILASAHMRRDGYRPVLAHEFGHVCTFEMGPKAKDMPWWALEGVAELATEEYTTGGPPDAFIRSLARSGRLGDWGKMSDFRTVPESDYAVVYPQGHHMLAFISDQWGRTQRNAWLRAMAGGKPIDDATREALGIPFAELDARWHKSIDPAKPQPATATEPAPHPDNK